MHPLPWTRAQKATQARQARLEARCRPPTLYLLPQGVQPEPAHQPTAHHQRLGWGSGTEERTELCGRVFVQRPRDEQCSYRRFHTGQVCPANLIEAQQLFHFFKNEFHLPPGAIHIQHVCRRPGAGVERGDEQQPSRHSQRGCRERAPRLLGFAACPASGAPRRRGIELGRDQSHGLPLSGPAPPAAPLPFGPPPVPQPAQHMAGLARLGVQGQGRRMAPYDHVRLLAHRRGHTAALAIAAVGYDDLPGVPAIPF